MSSFERLSALDQAFLAWESDTSFMHVACTLVFDAGPLATPDGGVDFAAVRRAVEAALPRVPRYRQRLARVPVEGGYGWVDDAQFRLDQHLHHVALPRPGSDAQLKALAGRIMQEPLHRARPLWEMWVVEGLSGGRFAVITKVHHCMVDGIAGVALMQRLLSPDPQAPLSEPPPWRPRPAPGALARLAGEGVRRATLPLQLLERVARAGPRESVWGLAGPLAALGGSLGRALRPATRTPLNGPCGPHRRLDWTVADLAEVRGVARGLGGTVNDLVLTVVSGAVRAWLMREGMDPSGVRFRVVAPVSTRPNEAAGTLGNHVSLWLVDLPVDEADPLRRHARVRARTQELKRERSALGAKLLADAAEWGSSTLLSLAARAAARLPAFQMVVTNVPGPQIPLYLAGARLREAFPVAPLLDGAGLNVALMSYDGRLCWGLLGDPDRVPDLPRLREDVEAAWAELRERVRAGRARAPAAQPARARRARRSPSAGAAGRSAARGDPPPAGPPHNG